MKLRHFVTGSSAILTGWLAVTFFHDVPAQRYQKLDHSPTTSAATEKNVPGTPADGPETPMVLLSASH